jgi:hypothetical protein
MKTITQFKIASIAVMLLGFIHICATPVIFPFFKANMNIEPASVYMFVMVGIYTFFIGWLQYFAIRKLNNDAAFGTILKVTALFLSVLGIAAVATMWNNPFAYISLLLAMYELILLRYIIITK